MLGASLRTGTTTDSTIAAAGSGALIAAGRYTAAAGRSNRLLRLVGPPRRLYLWPMPFDVREFPAPADALRAARNRRLVALWLFTVAGMILVMVVLGGATRLTGSGLSIMEWAPITGVLPPLNHADWIKLFDLYKRIPQYSMVNHGFGLAGFQQHLLARMGASAVGAADRGRLLRAAGLAVGTGRDRPPARPAAGAAVRARRTARCGRLVHGGVGLPAGFRFGGTGAAGGHLVLALALYAAILWTALSVLPPGRRGRSPARGRCGRWRGWRQAWWR